jgi:hypothetical protein
VSNEYDSTLKELLEDAPESWPNLVGRPGGTATVINADIGTVTGAADKVIRVSGPPDWILHVEAQAGPDASLPMRSHVYNVILSQRYGLPVHTVLLLLHRKANLARINGVHEIGFAGQEPYLRFRYQVIRGWEVPPERFLAGGPGTAPLAMIGAFSEEDLVSLVKKIKRQLRNVGSVGREKRLWSTAYFLGGLRFPPSILDPLFKEKEMEESSTWQATKAKGSREILLMNGRERLGEPTPAVLAAINAETSHARLLELNRMVLHADNWDELFPLPSQSSSRGRKRRGS